MRYVQKDIIDGRPLIKKRDADHNFANKFQVFKGCIERNSKLSGYNFLPSVGGAATRLVAR